ncbi:MAG: hypothetical protein A2571_00390 [Candidatus Vogelbacteria bacterium RIFOXYD1_FULL_44_32]|uniref:RNase H type-1 domain-containing protein n=1 Tax=Candidatus Vogelbacteria bacterium RIFOXYD1_FULL_44_32 TaxID=1802438 RepID=A0A1G2QE13_9BACT|nr:MAG: hypothetical protein A2571_00390 [Candidatus Vogelbacteria bacterium RIFOXYD1_FULL_44_32]
MLKIILNTDGGARGNPGPAGVGAVIYDENKKVVAIASKYIGETTNNEAEYQAVLLGLDLIKKNFSAEQIKSAEVELRVDSELIARQLAGKYKVKEDRLRVYHTQIKEILKTDFPNFKITEIRREQNKEADALANEAMDAK